LSLKRLYQTTGRDMPDWLDSEWTRLMDILEAIANGTAALIDTAGLVVSGMSTAIASTTEGYAPTFDLGDPKDWAVDQDRIDADTAAKA
jgi:hypothetical protein